MLRLLLVDGQQTVKLVVDPNALGEPAQHGFPDTVVARYPGGIPLDLNPRWPLQLDIDSDRGAFRVNLSFGGNSHTCRIPWRAVAIMGVGFGGVTWEHETEERPEPPGRGGRADKGGSDRNHLRVVK
jgi:hypothetical protein